jgi:hypothetical protein
VIHDASVAGFEREESLMAHQWRIAQAIKRSMGVVRIRDRPNRWNGVRETLRHVEHHMHGAVLVLELQSGLRAFFIESLGLMLRNPKGLSLTKADDLI